MWLPITCGRLTSAERFRTKLRRPSDRSPFLRMDNDLFMERKFSGSEP
jgi:hypothetical protein